MENIAFGSGGITLFDGGFGSQLTAAGIAFDCPERLNLENPQAVRAIHRAYAEAGAQVLETNTLGANPIRLRAHGLEARAAEITEAAVAHARAAGHGAVACSMGTTAAFLAPFGVLDPEDAARCFLVQARAARGADLIFTETLTDLAEARMMWMAAREAGLPFGASFSFLENGRTLSGSTPEVCAITAAAMGACLVGVNCVGEGALLLSIVRRMRAVTNCPVIAQPNAGLPKERDGRLSYDVTPEALLPTMRAALEAGAAAIGGCCGTTPAHIREMAALVQGHPAPAPGSDGVARICGPRQSLPLEEALHEYETMTPDALDASDSPAVLLDLRGVSPKEAVEAVDEAQLLVGKPLLFRASDEEVLFAALRRYPGVACVLGGPAAYGAVAR